MSSTRENPQDPFLTPRSPFRQTFYSTAEFIHFAQNLWLLYTEGKSQLAKWQKAQCLWTDSGTKEHLEQCCKSQVWVK